MNKIMKISILGAIIGCFWTNFAFAEQKTLVDYLNDQNVAFLIVNTGPNARLTTFGWKDASKTCKTIRTAGFNVGNVRNFDAETRDETNAVCKY